jgi:pimeloyl-ACP methyl ester carboxylesterase
MPAQDAVRRGVFVNGMEFLRWGDGPRKLLFIPGGPGSGLPLGLTGRMNRRWFHRFVKAGFTIWYVTRRRSMPRGHTVADMADDYADAIAEQLDGGVDLVVGESYGGMIAQYLAARHGESVGQVAIVVAAAEVSAWGKEVDTRLAAAVERGDAAAAGSAFAEYLIPSERGRWIRRLSGPWIGRGLLSGKSYPASDILVETEAELAFDARPVLPAIGVPVVILCGDRDLFFPPDIVTETARLIPDCTKVTYAGQGHVKVATSSRVPRDVLEFVDRR